VSTTAVYIGLASNAGDKQATITEALRQLRSRMQVRKVASLYETKPAGYPAQPRLLTTVAEAQMDLSAPDLLRFLKGVEHRLGRQSLDGPEGLRPIDLDILLYDEAIIDQPEVRVPHPTMHEQACVLVPLAEIAPHVRHPVLRRTAAELLAQVDRSSVRPARRDLALRLARDLQGETPDVSVRLGRVGVTNLHKTIRLGQGGRTRFLQAELSLFADIGPAQKGLHMSRLSHALDATIGEAVREEAPDVESLALRIAQRVVQSQQAQRSEVRIRAPFSLQRHAPVSGLPTGEIYMLLGSAVCTEDRARRMVGIEAEGMTACPCAQEMILQHSRGQLEEAGFGPQDAEKILSVLPTAAHNQRCRATLLLGTDAHVRAEDLVEIAEAAMSSETYGLLKRPDEFFVVHKAHRRPRFVEDVAREMLRAAVLTYPDLPGEDFLLARALSYESIHKHDAYADGGGTLEELRAQILEGQPAERCTTLEEWLG
jgi:GTP cyclohydrolase-4